MFKQWIKQFIALTICIITILSPISNVYAADYVKNDNDDDTNATYYIIDGNDVDKLFDLDISNVKDILGWLANFKTYTVIKSINVDNKTEYKAYFNTPNLQTLVKNAVISEINDGYTDSTYNINETQWMVNVGKNAKKENAITKYGFQISNPTYMGEYPKETMTIAGIVPTGFWDSVWRAIKAVLGISFLAAPDSDNYNTITYLNHGYKDKNAYIVDFFQKYYLKYFVRKIANSSTEQDYFDGPEDLISDSISEDQYNTAKSYNEEHKDEYETIQDKRELVKKINKEAGQIDFKKFYYNVQNGLFNCALPENNCNKYFNTNTIEEFFCSKNEYLEAFKDFITHHKKQLYTLAIASERNDLIVGVFPNMSTWTDFSIDASNNDTIKNLYIACNLGLKNICNGNYKLKVTTTKNKQSTLYKSKSSEIKSIAGPISGITFNSPEELLDDFFQVSIYSSDYAINLEDVLTIDEQIIVSQYEKNKTLMSNYEAFINRMNLGDSDEGQLLYRQCLIPNDGDDGECWSQKYNSTKTTITLAHVYAYSGLYKLTQNYSIDTDELTTSDTYKIINKIQSYCGPYYSDVLGNMIKLMCNMALLDNDTSPFKAIQNDDPRVMPYDVDTLVSKDAANYNTSDPRVNLYKTHVIGTIISDFSLSGGLGIFIKPQKELIKLGGRITELSVFMQQLCNFDAIEHVADNPSDPDSIGILSPTQFWKNGSYIYLLMAFLALFFIVKTVIAIFKMGSSNINMFKILGAFLVLVFELGLITAIVSNPDKTWTTVKNVETKLINLGEQATVYDNTQLQYLYGDDKSMEVTYYMPYLDLWSKYNTGYGMMDDEQFIDSNTDTAELKDYEPVTIGNSEIKHYSILLADSFSYYGKSTSLVNSVMEHNQIYNGVTINNNAYRVVDHFLAPRVNIEKKSGSDNLTLTTTENENYNGNFQSGFVDLLVKLLNCILMCLLSLIKFLTFLWQWFMLYIFIFKVVLGKGAEGKTGKIIFIETFSPTLCMIAIGLYAGVIMQLSMNVEGLIGILFEIFLFWLTFKLIKVWKELSHGVYFPKTLNWLYMITNFIDFKRKHKTNKLQTQAELMAKQKGHNDIDTSSFLAFTKSYFEESGYPKSTMDPFNKDLELYQNWYDQYCAIKETNSITDHIILNAAQWYEVNLKDYDPNGSNEYNSNSYKKQHNTDNSNFDEEKPNRKYNNKRHKNYSKFKAKDAKSDEQKGEDD